MENIRVFHICVSCNEGLLFRGRQDYIRFINNMALLADKYGVRILAFAVMSNHYHIGLMADSFERFSHSLRVSYANYYRSRYGSRLPAGHTFTLEAVGNLHIVVLLSYILRNPVHHGLVGHPFAYPYSSAGCYFSYMSSLYSIGHRPVLKRHKTRTPDAFAGDREGMIDPLCFVDYRMVETLYVTSGRFMYYLSRHSGPKWEMEQLEEDASVRPVTLRSVESQGVDYDECLRNERGHGKLLIPDQLICECVDGVMVPGYGCSSFAALSPMQQKEVGRKIRSKWNVSEEQLRRCLFHQ